MKKNPLLAVALIAFSASFFSCDKTPDRPSVDLPLRPIRFEFPAGSNPFNTYHFYVENVQTDILQVLALSGRKISDITEVRAIEGSFQADFADAQYRWFEEVSVRAYRGADRTNYLESFYLTPIRLDAGAQLQLLPSLADLKEFFQSDEVSFDIAIRPRGTTPESIPTQMLCTFKLVF